jgi:hypothetical protein
MSEVGTKRNRDKKDIRRSPLSIFQADLDDARVTTDFANNKMTETCMDYMAAIRDQQRILEFSNFQVIHLLVRSQ